MAMENLRYRINSMILWFVNNPAAWAVAWFGPDLLLGLILVLVLL